MRRDRRHYAVTTRDGSQLDVVVFDRDQQAAGTFYRLYRLIRVQGQVSRTAPLSVDRAVERRALLTYATEDAGVPTPRLHTLVRVGPDAAVLAYDHCDGNHARPAELRVHRHGAWPRLGHGDPAARAPRRPPRAHRRPHRLHRRRPGHAARPGRRRRGGERPADAPGPGTAHRRAGAGRGTGEVRSARGGADRRKRTRRRPRAAPAGRARPLHQARAAPTARRPARRPQGAARGRARR